MKKIFMLFAFFGLVSFAATAQSCTGKTAATKKSACCAKTKAAAAKLASLDNSIESRTCAKSGTVSYVKKNVCAQSGKVSYTNVEYCTKSKKFVNVSPSTEKKASCTKAAGAKKVSSVDGKKTSCTAAQKASCAKKGMTCTKKSASAKTSAAGSNAKLVKQENN